MDPASVAQRLAKWYEGSARDLPWRNNPEPYQVLLSEFILQQTRMEVGLRYYEAILKRFPTLASLAKASEENVLAAWSGLGYYSRAKNLHKTARTIMTQFNGKIPSDPQTLQTLPGIGPYTAGAIASIAYDKPVPSLDGNQYRVLGRLLGTPTEGASARRNLFQQAQRLLHHGSPRVLNQALMELGSLRCLPQTPRCHECPLRSDCATQGQLPHARKTTNKPRREHWDAILHVHANKVWLVPPKEHGLLAGSWLPPMHRSNRRTSGQDAIRHVFSHREWIISTRFQDKTPLPPGRWVSRRTLQKIPHSRLTMKLMERALNQRTI